MSGEGQGSSSPATYQNQLGFPSNAGLYVFEQFSTLNTKALRPGIKDEEMSWCDGFMPIGPNNLRTLYGVGSALYTAPGSLSIPFFGFGNLLAVPICVVLQSDGSLIQINTNTGMTTQMAPAGTITNPTSLIGFSQWSNLYTLISANQNNGYWIWDGTSLYTAGSISPEVTVTNSGLNYAYAPTITLQTTGAGTGVTFSPVLDNGSIDNINITNPGSGFADGDLTVLTITGGGSDNTATAIANVSPGTGGVSGVIVLNSGTGYPANTTITATGGGGTGATFFIQAASGGAITGVGILNPGTGYTSVPTIIATGIGGSGFSAKATVAFGEIASISIPDNGSGYITEPSLTIIGDGSGAVLVPQINNTGQLIAVTVIAGGSGYTKALIQISGGNNAASATIGIMPFGISGTAIETYSGHVWIAKGATILFSAPDSVSDFSTSDGGGAFTSKDSFLNVGFTYLKQSNGFLYLGADSALNYVSGVTTSGNPSVTTFQSQNVDPQIGTPWPGTLQVFSRNLVFGNSLGIYVSYGGAVTKISEPLDGIYNTVPGFGGFLPSSAIANIFGIEVYMQLTPVIDTYTGQQVNKLLMWSGQKWFTSQQDVPLTYIASQKINSVLTAWGTTGSAIYPLFQQPSIALQKVAQSKLWGTPHYLYTKTGVRLYGVLNYYQNDNEAINVTIDNESGSASYNVPATTNSIAWTNNSGDPIEWFNNSSQPILWVLSGITVFGPEAVGQFGRLLGMTIITQASDVSIISTTLMDQTYQANV